MPKTSSSKPENQQPLGTSVQGAGGASEAATQPSSAASHASDGSGQQQQQQQQAMQGEDPAAREERIRNAAYDAYVRRGGEPGDEVQDWLDAESQVDGRKG